MNKQVEKQMDEMEIDLLELAKVLWHKAWVIALVAIICGMCAFSYAAFAITPLYRASGLMYVNNSTVSFASGFAVSVSELEAAQSLVDTYVVILNSRNTLNEVIDRAGLDYSYEQVAGMVSASAVDDTEIFSFAVTSPDPVEAELIANTIAEVLPERIADIVDGSSVRVVDYAIVPQGSIYPNVKRYTAMGLLFGAMASSGLIVLYSLLDTTITSEEYLKQHYDIPVLAVVPELSPHRIGRQRAGKANYGKADNGKANNGRAEHGKADHGKADHGKADYGKAEYGKADYGKADHGKSDSGKPDSGNAYNKEQSGEKSGRRDIC